ncbi:MAG: phosphoheptose isomerase [Candidatus Bathyarchaeia archaeon]
MPKKIMIIDIDGTICEDIKNEEGMQRMAIAEPYRDSIRQINRWYQEGHFICFFTAREEVHLEVTEKWLRKEGVKYHRIIYGKPRRTTVHSEYHFIDNCKIRATKFNGKFSEFVKKRSDVLVFPGD